MHKQSKRNDQTAQGAPRDGKRYGRAKGKDATLERKRARTAKRTVQGR